MSVDYPGFPHPCDENMPLIYCTIDGCHALKLIRNAWSDLGVFVDDKGDLILWIFIQKLNEIQQGEGLRAGNKLREAHLQWKKAPVKVNLAVQTLNS